MAKLARETFKFFGSSSGSNQIEQFGSLAGGSPNYSTDVTVIQALSAWLEGWFGAVVGSNLPAIEDMNAVFYVFAYMISYLFQQGIPEWDAGTTYYIGSLAQDGSGIIYTSLQNNNLNHALSNTSFWARQDNSTDIVTIDPGVTPTYAMTLADADKTFLVLSANGTMGFTLPAPTLNFKVKIKDTGDAQGNNITINPHASETIDGQNSIVMSFNYGWVEFTSDGTNWFITDQSKNISPWLQYTPASISGFGTPSGVLCFWRRVGMNLEIQGQLTTGTTTATGAAIATPTGIGFQFTLGAPMGVCMGNVGGNTQTGVSIESSTEVVFYAQGAPFVVANGSQLVDSSVFFGFSIAGPGAGWTNY